jgi:hypothetical protein
VTPLHPQEPHRKITRRSHHDTTDLSYTKTVGGLVRDQTANASRETPEPGGTHYPRRREYAA